MSVGVVAFGARSAFGVGEAAVGSLAIGAKAITAVRADARLLEAGMPVAPVARAGDTGTRHPAKALLLGALADAMGGLDAAIPEWRRGRVGLALGTSSGEMHGQERALRAIVAGARPEADDAACLFYGEPFLAARAALGLVPAREASVLAACVSSTMALGLASTWLDAGACDVVLAGGYDAVADFVASGFGALLALTRSTPRPFSPGRDGLALGEGACVLALARGRAPARFFLSGFAASTDAQHVTAPAQDGTELRRAALAACERAGVTAGLVSLHGTATVANDEAEARAVAGLGAPMFAAKGALGHTLGASGALETLQLGLALEAGVAPGTAGDGAFFEGCDLAPENRAHRAEAGLKLSAAFGGANAALVVTRTPTERTPTRLRASVHGATGTAHGPVDAQAVARRAGIPDERLPRLDHATLLGLAAALDLRDAVGEGALRGAGVVVSSAYATLSTNEAYVRRLVARGLRGAEPRRFPYTSPNAVAGEIAIALGLHGPSLCEGGHPDLLRANEIAHDLIAAGIAPAMLVVEVEAPGPAGPHAARSAGRQVADDRASATLVTRAWI